MCVLWKLSFGALVDTLKLDQFNVGFSLFSGFADFMKNIEHCQTYTLQMQFLIQL